MSTNTTPEPDDFHLDAWIARQVQDLTNRVSGHLDLSAGLRDAQLSDRARTLDSALDEVLDIETGLQAIVGRTSQPQQEHAVAGARPPLPPVSLTHYAQHLTRLPANQRLMLRTPLTLHILGLIRTLAELRIAPERLIAAFDLTHALDNDDVLTRDLRHALDLRRLLDQALDASLGLTFDLIHASRGRALDRAEARARAMNLAHALDAALTHAHARDAIGVLRALDNARVHARAVIRDLNHALDHALGYAREHAHVPALDPDLAKAIQRAGFQFSTPGEFAGLASAIENVEAAIADFTTADLTGLNLQGLDLRGVRWSALTTRWPPGWEPFIREVSVQIDPDELPDLYEVRDEPHVRHNVHLQ